MFISRVNKIKFANLANQIMHAGHKDDIHASYDLFESNSYKNIHMLSKQGFIFISVTHHHSTSTIK